MRRAPGAHGARGSAIGLVALLGVTVGFGVGSARASVSRRAPSCHEKTAAFQRETAPMFDAWVLPDSVDRPSAVLTRGCHWITSMQRFVPKPGVSVWTAAQDLMAALRADGYHLERAPDVGEEVGVWRTRTCPDVVQCDLVVSVVDSEEAIEAEFLRDPARCHSKVAALRVEAARAFDSWALPEGVVRSSSPDRASAGPCVLMQSVRRFAPAPGTTASSAAERLVSALAEQGYLPEPRTADDKDLGLWFFTCPDRPECILSIVAVDAVDHARVEAELSY